VKMGVSMKRMAMYAIGVPFARPQLRDSVVGRERDDGGDVHSTEQRPSTVIRALGPHIELPITCNEETLAVALNAPRRR